MHGCKSEACTHLHVSSESCCVLVFTSNEDLYQQCSCTSYRAHMADTEKLAEQRKQAEDKARKSQAVVEANIALQQEVADLKRKQHWDQLKAREDAFCAQQQLEAGRTALNDAISTMETRISTLMAQGQVSFPFSTLLVNNKLAPNYGPL